MLTPIQLIHQLNRRCVVTSRPSHTQSFSFPDTVRFQTILAIIGLGLGGLGVETARAKSLDFGDVRHLELATSNQSSPERSKIAQTTTNPASDSNIKLPNDLNLPKTGREVQITGTRAITIQEAIDLAFRVQYRAPTKKRLNKNSVRNCHDVRDDLSGNTAFSTIVR